MLIKIQRTTIEGFLNNIQCQICFSISAWSDHDHTEGKKKEKKKKHVVYIMSQHQPNSDALCEKKT